MVQNSLENLLKRKITAQHATSRTGGFQEFFARAFVGEAQRRLKIDLSLSDVREHRVPRPAFAERIAQHSVIFAVEGAQGTCGVVAVGPSLVSALIEWQILGQVRQDAPATRTPTGTDAMLCRDLAAEALGSFANRVGEQTGQVLDASLGGMISEPRGVEFALKDTAMRVYSGDAALSPDSRHDTVLIALPEPFFECVEVAEPAVATSWSEGFAAKVGEGRTSLSVELGRVEMPLAEALSLEVGQMIDLPRHAIETVVFRAGNSSVGVGRLGQINGYRAVKIQPHDGLPSRGEAFACADDPVPQSPQAAVELPSS